MPARIISDVDLTKMCAEVCINNLNNEQLAEMFPYDAGLIKRIKGTQRWRDRMSKVQDELNTAVIESYKKA